jgi:hypothetical protein
VWGNPGLSTREFAEVVFREQKQRGGIFETSQAGVAPVAEYASDFPGLVVVVNVGATRPPPHFERGAADGALPFLLSHKGFEVLRGYAVEMFQTGVSL